MKIILLALLLATLVSTQYTCDIHETDRLECGFNSIKQQECEARGCCWREGSFPGLDIPYCYRNANDGFCKKFNFQADYPGFDGSYDTMYSNFLKNLNIGNNGGVVAAPDTDTPGGTYYFHWMRDAALSMKTFMILNDYKIDKIQYNMDKYVQWVQKAQKAYEPHSQSVLNDPKFMLPNGEVYAGPWCRPQTDGPGLRATTMIHYANALINAGKEDIVREKLWRQDGQGVIQIDLNYINDTWGELGCDLWEEIRSDNIFFNRMAFHQALTIGAKLAARFQDHRSHEKFLGTAGAIKYTLLEHYNGEFITESANRLGDSAVIHALTTMNEGVFDISGVETAKTVKYLNQVFCNEYLINQTQDAAGIPGILYGRYKGDEYAGGNPWQLLTATLAELFYQISEQMEAKGHYLLKPHEADPWRDTFELSEMVFADDFAKVARKAGNSVMYRMWTHLSTSFHTVTEQIDRNTGYQISAKHLTWSYANILRTLHSHVYNRSSDEATV